MRAQAWQGTIENYRQRCHQNHVTREAKAERMIQEMALGDLRAARALTQAHLPTILGVKQSALSKLEHRADMYVITPQHFVEAMGWTMEIRGVYPRRRADYTALVEGNSERRTQTIDPVVEPASEQEL
jgi:hypothetical protein